jgi:hypothetical protein
MKLSILSLFSACIILFSCQKQVHVLPEARNSSKAVLGPTSSFSSLRVGDIPCGQPLVTDMVTSSYPPVDEQVKGKLTISNDETNLYITVSTLDSGVYVGHIQVLYGDSALIKDINQYSWDGWFGVNDPQISAPVTGEQSSFTIQIPLSELSGNCTLFNVHSLFYTFDQHGHKAYLPVWTKPLVAGSQVMSFPWTAYVQYCKQTCAPPPPPPTCGQLRTQTPGGWGAPPRGNNPASYLYANFSNAFPNGVVIGCVPNYNIKLTTATAVTNFLPSGGKAVKLTSNYTNPDGFKNVLAGHLVALTLSVGFDAYDANFASAGITLGAMQIKSGAFAGWTVSEFLAEANKVLGGCSSNFTIEQVLETATAINENYVDGKRDNGFLVCPTVKKL